MIDPVERKFAQDVYLRVCRDSGFQLDMFAAANLAAGVMKISTMELWVRMDIPIAVMDQIAQGIHAICR